MTFAFGSFTLGAALLFSAFKNMSLVDLIMGRSGESIAGQGESHPGAGSAPSGSENANASASTASAAPANVKGLVQWKNPDGNTVLIAKWINAELRKVNWHGYIESGYRSYQDQVRVCATGVKPCAAPGTSNHQGKVFPKGAIDVRQTEAGELSAKLQRIHSPLKYAGSKDPVHFSHPHGGSY